ncbi:hypothetical protein BDR26DRAFT_916996 [Obelidium mucronatum]|nr:hypothetical protein BDR26DRAFT_916996 [Obelidium mucronatum]
MKISAFERKYSSINSDGSIIGFVKTANGTSPSQIHLVNRDEAAEKSRVAATVEGISSFGWTQHSDVLWYSTGTEKDSKIYTLNIFTQALVCLTPENGTVNKIAGTSKYDTNHILILSNKRNPSTATLDLYYINIHNAKERILLENDGNFTSIIPNPLFTSAAALRTIPSSNAVEIYNVQLNIQNPSSVVVTKRVSTKTATVTKTLPSGIKETTTSETVSTNYVSSTAKISSSGTLVVSISAKDRLLGENGRVELSGFDQLAEFLYISIHRADGSKKVVACDLNGIERRVLDRDCIVDPSTHEELACSEASYNVLAVLTGSSLVYKVESTSSSGFSWVVSIGQELYLYNRATNHAHFLFRSINAVTDVVVSAVPPVEQKAKVEKRSIIAPSSLRTTLPIERHELMSA